MIEISLGSILPVQRTLWQLSEEKLIECEAAISVMKNADNRIQYEKAWTNFVDSIQQFWVRFNIEGEDSFLNFGTWADEIKKYRNHEYLLKYFYIARNNSQHALLQVNWENTVSINICTGFSGHIKSLQLYNDHTFEIDAKPLNPNGDDANLSCSFGKPRMPDITDKDGKSFPAPTEFCGSEIPNSCPTVASNLVLNFNKKIFNQALTKFGRFADK